jgi:nucleotide-binding universal stress UspA family protein
MSAWKRILVHITDGPRSREVLRLAASLATEHEACVTALHAVDPMPRGAYLTPEASTIAERMSEEARDARRVQARERVADIERNARCRISFDSAGGDPLDSLLREARAADLLVLGQRNPEEVDGTTPGLAARLLVSGGTPLLFVPFAGDYKRCGRRVLIGWAESRESTRALRDAMPLLRRADAVELLHFVGSDEDVPKSEPAEAVAAYLRQHGVPASTLARQSRAPSVGELMLRSWHPDAPVAEALLSHAADTGADLIVMGGFGHSRAWELALGGVTRTMLKSMTVPVLMSH